MDNKRLAKVQVYVGLFLLLATLIAGVWVIREVYIGALTEGVHYITETWAEIGEDTSAAGHVINAIVLEGTIVRASLPLFVVGELILIALAMLMIFQGLKK
ncbi:hypothetical protein KY330_04270 [Candidatus Woesearchaeota archaeon]|nr:hypothetical protein [Candidatus Woesearchaeota archaeon]